LPRQKLLPAKFREKRNPATQRHKKGKKNLGHLTPTLTVLKVKLKKTFGSVYLVEKSIANRHHLSAVH